MRRAVSPAGKSANRGLDATRGTVKGACVKAYKTITFGLPKAGFFKKEAKPYAGKAVTKDIGLPKRLLAMMF